MKVELVSKTIGVGIYEGLKGEEIIAAVARHGKVKEDKGRLVKYLMKHKHWSPLQFAQFTFRIETNRRISQQIFRHMFEKQEFSQRYEISNSYENFELRLEHETNRQSSSEKIAKINFDGNQPWAESEMSKYDEITFDTCKLFNDINRLYEKMIANGIAKECAANILPMSTKTYIHISGNFRTFLSFLNVRCDEHSQKEIRDIAYQIGNELEKELPDIMKLIDWKKGMFM